VVDLVKRFAPDEACEALVAGATRAGAPAPTLTKDLVDLVRNTTRLQDLDAVIWRLLAPSGNQDAFDAGFALLIQRYPGLLNRILMDDASLRTREQIMGKILKDYKAELDTTSALWRLYTTRKQYIHTRKVSGRLIGLRITAGADLNLFNTVTLGADAAHDIGGDLLPEAPELHLAGVGPGKKSIGVSGGVAALLRYVLGFPGVRAALQEMGTHKLLVKACTDAARLVGSHNVTAFCLMIVLRGRGDSSRYAFVETMYFDDDHHGSQAAYLDLGGYSELKTLEAEGLQCEWVRGPVKRLGLKSIFALDGAGARAAVGAAGASCTFPVVGIPVLASALGDSLLRPTAIAQELTNARLIAATWPSDVMGADNATNRGEFSLEALGFKNRDTLRCDLVDLKIEVLHGTMNLGKHMLMGLYAIFVAYKRNGSYQDVLSSFGIDYFVGKAADNKTEVLSVCNGVHYAKFYCQEIWDALAKVLREAGHLHVGACVRYLGTLCARFSAVLLNHVTVAKHWVDISLLAVTMGTVLRCGFYEKVISPAVFELIKVLPEQIRLIYALEKQLGVPEEHRGQFFSVVDVHFNGAFEHLNYALSELLRNSSRGGGRSKRAIKALGETLAATKSKYGNTLGAQYNNLISAVENHRVQFALRFIMDLETDVHARRLKRRDKRTKAKYGDLPAVSQFGHPAAIPSSHGHLLDLHASVAAPPFVPPVPLAAAPAGDAGAPPDPPVQAVASGDDSASSSESETDEDDSSSDEDPDDAPPTIEGLDVDAFAAAGLEHVEGSDDLTLDTAAADLKAAGKRGTTTSGKIKTLICGPTTLNLDESFSSVVKVNKDYIRIVLRLEKDPLGMQIVIPHNRINAFYYYDDKSIALVLSKPPTFWRQHQTRAGRTDGATALKVQYAWTNTPTADPTENAAASRHVLLRVTASTRGMLNRIVDHVNSLPLAARPHEIKSCPPPMTLCRKEIPAPDAAPDGADDAVEPDGAVDAQGDYGPQAGIANLRAFPKECHEFFVEVDKLFYRFASHRATTVKNPFDEPAATTYVNLFLRELKPQQTHFFKVLARTEPLVYGLNELEG